MGLKLEDQYSQVVGGAVKTQVVAATFTAALTAFGATPLTEPKQTQRVTLANNCVKNPACAWETFAWFVVSRPSLTTTDGLTDTFIQATVTAAFDNVSQQVIPAP